MKTIFKKFGGSISYGLNTPNSDSDYIGVFCHTEPRYILGLNRFDHLIKKSEAHDNVNCDDVNFEVRHFLSLLNKGNTMAMECLFDSKSIQTSPEWDLIFENKFNLLDKKAIYKSLKGYMQGELRLALGIRTGKLGSKRFESVEAYGFSPKNFVQLLRLAYCGRVFFETGYFPVNIKVYDSDFARYLLSIKTSPKNFTPLELRKKCEEYELALDSAYQKCSIYYKFDPYIANDLLLKIYKPFLSTEGPKNSA